MRFHLTLHCFACIGLNAYLCNSLQLPLKLLILIIKSLSPDCLNDLSLKYDVNFTTMFEDFLCICWGDFCFIWGFITFFCCGDLYTFLRIERWKSLSNISSLCISVKCKYSTEKTHAIIKLVVFYYQNVLMPEQIIWLATEYLIKIRTNKSIFSV